MLINLKKLVKDVDLCFLVGVVFDILLLYPEVKELFISDFEDYFVFVFSEFTAIQFGNQLSIAWIQINLLPELLYINAYVKVYELLDILPLLLFVDLGLADINLDLILLKILTLLCLLKFLDLPTRLGLLTLLCIA